MRDRRQAQDVERADLDVAEWREAANDVVDDEAVLAPLLAVREQLLSARGGARPGQRHRGVRELALSGAEGPLAAEEQLRRRADQTMTLIRVAVRPPLRRERRQPREKELPVVAARQDAGLEDDRHDFLEVVASHVVLRRVEKRHEV